VENQDKRVVILGGGTAGWMAASLMNKQWSDKGISITLVESPDIGVIGVGEGSTPLVKTFFDLLGMEEHEWMPQCNATYKNGIRFDNWCTKPGFESYFHPFPSALDVFSLNPFEHNTLVRRRGVDVEAHPDKFFLASVLAEKGLGPIPHDNFPFEVDYAYHFDSILLGQFLKKKAIEKGVNHIEANVVKVNQHANGDISSLQTESGKTIDGEFFVDCTGFAGVLIQKTLNVPFIDFSSNLFNDSAIAMPSAIDEDMPSETLSTALTNGWAWKIPLQNRFGNGYVYSSRYCSSDEAETELRAHIGLLDADVEARHIKMNVGRVVRNWSKNCVAIGLSQGFVEPLEASALQVIQASIQGFIEAWESGEFTNKNRILYNARVESDLESIRDYIVLHYKSNSRTDTEYWKDNHENQHVSDSLKRMINCWLECGDLAAEIDNQYIESYYPSISWHSIFAGMAIFPDEENLGKGTASDYKVDVGALNNLLNRSALNFDPHRQYLEAQGR